MSNNSYSPLPKDEYDFYYFSNFELIFECKTPVSMLLYYCLFECKILVISWKNSVGIKKAIEKTKKNSYIRIYKKFVYKIRICNIRILHVHYVQLYMYIAHVYRSGPIDTVGLSLFLLNQEPQMNTMNV